jgi:hypothetical protein
MSQQGQIGPRLIGKRCRGVNCHSAWPLIAHPLAIPN